MSNAMATLNYASLDAAVSALGSTATTLIIDTALPVIANTTVPSTLTLEFTGSGSLTVPNGVTVTINGPILSPIMKIFSLTGTGAISLATNRSLEAIQAAWWGIVGDGSTDNTAALQAALNAASVVLGGAKVYLPSGGFVISSPLKLGPRTDLIGSNYDNCELIPVSCDGFHLYGTDWPIAGAVFSSSIRDLAIYMGAALTSAAIDMNNVYALLFENLHIWNCGSKGITVNNAGGFNDVEFRRVAVSGTNVANSVGVLISNPSYDGDSKIYNLDVEQWDVGLKIVSGSTHAIFGIYSEQCNVATVQLDATIGVLIAGPIAYQPPSVASAIPVKLVNGCTDTIIIGGNLGINDTCTTAVSEDGTCVNTRVIGTNLQGAISGDVQVGNGVHLKAVTYSASMTLDSSTAQIFLIVATNNTAFTINAPTSPQIAYVMTVTIKNTSGGALGAATWNAVFKMGAAWTQPANGFSRSIDFYYNGTNWIEKSRTAADVAN